MAKLVKTIEHFIDECVEQHSIGKFKPHHRVFNNKEHGFKVDWWSRDHRKNRHPKVLPLEQYEKRVNILDVEKRIRFWGWEWWNLSWWVAQFFFWGSVVWTINGTLAMWPLNNDELQNLLSGWTAFTGGLIFIFGGYAAFLEVLNQHKKIRLGHLLKVIEESEEEIIHSLKPLSGKQEMSLIKHKLREIRGSWTFFGYEKGDWGWWLNSVQLCGALVFFIACVTAVPGVIPEKVFIENFIYWMPQVVGAVFFVIASWMAMREVQLTLFSFPINKIGWQAGLWNLVGAVGFFLCGLFGIICNSPKLLTSSLSYWGGAFSTFWGSLAFLLASYLMLIEILNRHKK